MSEVLANLSNALAGAVETAGPSIVRVEARRRLPASGIVWSADGIIVTAHHVVEEDEAIGIGLADGRTVSASLVGRDPTTDIAVLRAQANGLTPPAWVGAETLKVGPPGLGLGPPRGERDGDPGHRERAEQGLAHACRRPVRLLPANRRADVPRLLRRPRSGRGRRIPGVQHLSATARDHDDRADGHPAPGGRSPADPRPDAPRLPGRVRSSCAAAHRAGRASGPGDRFAAGIGGARQPGRTRRSVHGRHHRCAGRSAGSSPGRVAGTADWRPCGPDRSRCASFAVVRSPRCAW